jgi:hypothetical protein
MPAQPHDHDPVQCRVGLAVAAAVEPVPHGRARGCLDRERRTASKRRPPSAGRPTYPPLRVGVDPRRPHRRDQRVR